MGRRVKRLLLTLALCLSASAAADAQRKGYVEFRSGDTSNGHVKSVRVETAIYTKVGGAFVEGPRRLATSADYSPDGKRKEEENYEPDGSLVGRTTITDDQSGENFEVVSKDRDGRPRSRTRQTREYDSHKNLLKLTYYNWDDAANGFVPSSVSYYIITYYD
ncbi:MAG TPA: hypothetical protein VM936_22640 [Pyrinomonadaceae bacterium]|jgi:hypothetical protein|nr:hypothetical protein [Pyrinomonadaceae bacterium]